MQTRTGFDVQQQRGAPAVMSAPVDSREVNSQGAATQTAEFENIDTQYGSVRVNLASLMLGELLVSDEGAELEVVGLNPLELVLAPEEEEDWGE